ncbi:OmpA family protein [Wenxinia marina]|nr:OmpA family protein [Wenxinia marina]
MKSTSAAAIVIASAPVWVAAQDAETASACSIDTPELPCVGPDGTLVETPDEARALLESLGVEDIEGILSRLDVGAEGSLEAPRCDPNAPALPCTLPDGQVVTTEVEARTELEARGLGQLADDLFGPADADPAADASEAAPETAPEAEATAEATPEVPRCDINAPQLPCALPDGQLVTTQEEARAALEARGMADVADQMFGPSDEADDAEVVATDEAMDGADENMTTEAPVATAEAEMQEEVEGDLPACDFDNPTLPCVTDEGQILRELRQFRDYVDATPGQNRREVMQRLRANLGMPAEQETPPAAAAAAEGDEPQGEVVTEQVTEENSRQADEEFDTAVNENVEATEDEDDDGLDNFQRALLVGLGAVAVGSILNNGDEVVANTGDRVVVDTDAGLQVLKNDDALLRQPGSEIRTENFADGSSRTFVDRADGSQVVTIRAADGRVLRRSVIFPDGSEVQLFDDTAEVAPVEVSSLPQVEEQAQARMSDTDEQALRAALMASLRSDVGRTFSLQQVRQYEEVRALAPQVALDSVTFATGSAAIDQAASDDLVDLGVAISSILDEDPSQVFLIEGHTDTVGDAGYNLALSDRRAETVALALTQFFDVPPENLITQGYGESDLLIEQEGDIRENRRAAVRNITGLLR